ncbi:hypothetical protein FF100_04600 [Methylobacterium terricola]|uniref:Uncharacterized protein n=1 Tax=Methylobacterium terricola TaxID=2583531 RepID=A0A5C4LPV4_9HYPH|nr:hypothetical protein [Methylobacterium terricola]TNC14862.1 hypothetical protein FF100_04600 [Methylobacterium terricola]
MHKVRTVPLTDDLMIRIGRLRKAMAAGNTPREVAYVKKRLAEAEANAAALYVLFGGRIDQSAIDEAVFWKMELDGAYLRAAEAGKP